MQQSVTIIVEHVLRESTAYGLAQSTVHQYRRGLFRPIIRFFDENGNGMYDTATLEFCRAKYQNALERGDIKRRHFLAMNKALSYIEAYAETGAVSFSRVVSTKSFVPSAEALLTINAALARTDLKDGFKYKIDCILRKFFCFIESSSLASGDITTDIILGFINCTRLDNAGSMEYVTYSIKILLDYLRAENIADIKLDLSYFTPRSSPRRIIAAFTEQEVEKILSCVDTSTTIGKRDYAIILLACGTGLRGVDIVNLKLQDINWNTGQARIVQSKTGSPIVISISGQILNAIADYILNGRQQSGSQNIFLRSYAPFVSLKGTSALDGIIDEICIKASVEKRFRRSFHSLRRSFGTWMSSEEVPITTIAQMLGHKKVNSSKPYISFNDRQMLGCALGFEDIPLRGGVYA